MDAFVNRVVAPGRGRSPRWAPAPAPAALPPMTAPLRTRLVLSGGELDAMNARFAAAAEVEPATTKFKSLAADFAVVANAETGAYDFRLLRASAEQPDERVVGATTLVLREIIPLVFPVSSLRASCV